MNATELDLIAIGEILKPQGIKGELKVMPLTDNLKRFAELRRVYLKGQVGLKELEIVEYRYFMQFVLLKFAGVDDLDAAISLGRGLIMIPRQERPQLPAGRYYLDQIEGLNVFTEANQYLGQIVQILETGSNDVYVVKETGRAKAREVLIPALRQVVKEVDLSAGKMVVVLPAGLLEDEV